MALLTRAKMATGESPGCASRSGAAVARVGREQDRRGNAPEPSGPARSPLSRPVAAARFSHMVRGYVVLRHAQTGGVHEPEGGLGVGVTLFSRVPCRFVSLGTGWRYREQENGGRAGQYTADLQRADPSLLLDLTVAAIRPRRPGRRAVARRDSRPARQSPAATAPRSTTRRSKRQNRIRHVCPHHVRHCGIILPHRHDFTS